MFRSAMSALDRFAMGFAILLGALPVLTIACHAAII